MNQYVTGTMIRHLRENKSMTQQQLAEIIGVSDKAISKWETGRGYPDISLI
jgi:transcriptional regulator with XRE-family HTH domain